MALPDRLKAAGFATDTLKPLARTDQGQIWTFDTPGGQPAIDLWHKLRSQLHVHMHTPIILGDSGEATSNLLDNLEFNDNTVEEMLRTAAMVDGSEVLERLAGDDRGEAQMPMGDWPAEAVPSAVSDFVSVRDILSSEPLPSVTIAMVPTIASWMVPAYLKFGSFNDCPPPEDHVSVLKYWTRLYAIDVFAVTGSVIEAQVTNPPATHEAAMKLAREQYAYCPDIVDQGTETIANLAAGLLNGRSWFFWWD